MFFLALLMFILAGRYLTLNPEVYFPEQKAVYIAHTTGLLIHIIGAMLTVITGLITASMILSLLTPPRRDDA